MSIRAKFLCISKEHDTNNDKVGTIAMQPVVSGSPENEQFFENTPSGSLQLGILNPEAFSQFEPGKEYYAEFSPAE